MRRVITPSLRICLLALIFLLPCPPARAAWNDVVAQVNLGFGVNLRGLAWDGTGLWYTVFNGDGLIHKVATDGTPLGAVPGPETNMGGLAWDGQYLWAASYTGTGKVYQLDPSDGTVISWFDTSSLPGISEEWWPGYIDGLAWSEGLWLSADSGRNIYHVSAAGALLSRFSVGFCASGHACSGAYLYAVDAGEPFGLYRSSILRLQRNGAELRGLNTIDCQFVEDLAYDGSRLWAATTVGTIYAFDVGSPEDPPLSVVEASLDLGSVPAGESAVGCVTVRNLGPSAVSQVRASSADLSGPAALPHDAIAVEPSPAGPLRIADEQRIAFRLRVPATQPAGAYSGTQTVFADDDGDGMLDPEEKRDTFALSVTVTAAPRVPVVVVGGIGAGDNAPTTGPLSALRAHLLGVGYNDADIHYFTDADGFDETAAAGDNAKALAAFIQSEGLAGQAFAIAAHDTGGLIARQVLQEYPVVTSGVTRLVEMGAPLGGSRSADVLLGMPLLADRSDFAALRDTALPYTRLNRPGWAERSGVRYRSLAGSVNPWPATRFLPFAFLAGGAPEETPNDGATSVKSAFGLYPEHAATPANDASHRIVAYDHGELATDQAVFDDFIWPALAGDAWEGASPQQPARQPEVLLHLADTTSDSVTQGQTRTWAVPVDAATQAIFGICWQNGTLDLTLEDPAGTPIDPTVASGDPDIEYLTDSDPALGQSAAYVVASPAAGTWTLRVTGTAVTGSEPFDAVAQVRSGLTLVAWTDYSGYGPSDPVLVLAQLSAGGAPVTGASVSASITRPDAATDSVALYDDGAHGDGAAGDGVYGAWYATAGGGAYRAAVSADGGAFRRLAHAVFTVDDGSAALTGSFADAGEDSDFDGVYDDLRVDVGLSVAQAGDYTVRGTLADGSGTPIETASQAASLNPGMRTVSLRFSAEAILARGVNGPHQLARVDAFHGTDVPVWTDGADPAYGTAAYSLADFDTSPQIAIVEPDGVGDAADSAFAIVWSAGDAEQDALITLYCDTDAAGHDGTPIVSGLTVSRAVPAYAWDTSALAPGDYYVYAEINDGIKSAQSAYGAGPVTVSHRGRGTASGHVYDLVTGDPIAEATVILGTYPMTAKTVTDAAGAYTITDFPAGSSVISAGAPGYRSRGDLPCTVPAGSTVWTNIRLTPRDLAAGDVYGFVTDAATSNPIAGAWVRYHGDVICRSGASGYYELTDLPAGWPGLVATKSGYRSEARSTRLRDRERVRLDFALTPGPQDTTPPGTPTVSVTSDTGGAPPAWVLYDNTQVRATWTSTDAESGIELYQYAIGTTPGGTDVRGWSGADAATDYTITGLSLAEGGPYYLSVKARNGAGLWSGMGTSDGFYVDVLPPEIYEVVLGSGPYTQSSTVTVHIRADDPGVQITQVCLMNYGSQEPNPWHCQPCPAPDGGGWIDLPGWDLLPGEGWRAVYVQLCNEHGHCTSRANPERGEVTVDKTKPTPPPGLTAVMQGAAVYLEWQHSSESGSGIDYYAIYRRESGGSYGATPVATSPNRWWSDTDPALQNGVSYCYRVTCLDRAGNESDPSNEACLAYLESKPTIDTFLINGAATWTKSTSVTLTIVASADATEMQFKNQGDASWGSWLPYATQADWTLISGDGWKTVYCKVRDQYTSESLVANDGIKLDATPPTSPSPLTVTPNAGGGMDLAWQASSDGYSGMYRYEIFRGTQPDGSDAIYVNQRGPAYTTFTDWGPGLVDGQTYYYYVEALDVARNRTRSNVAGATCGQAQGDKGTRLPPGTVWSRQRWLKPPALATRP